MTTVKTLATHDIVTRAYPRPVTEKDEVGKAVGKAIDTAMSRYSHEYGQHRKPTTASMHRLAADVLDGELQDADVALAPGERDKVLIQTAEVLKAFRRSEIFGLPRPKSRLILINSLVGIYAQPDYWDRANRFYEMKSYRAVPPPPDVELQLTMFQLAFAGFAAFLICLDRHTSPVEVTVSAVPELTDERAQAALRLALATGREHGTEKVLEYIDSPVVRYDVEA